MKKFRIRYKDPDTGQIETVEQEFEDGDGIPAIAWAKDYGYTLADKGWYEVKEIL